MLHIWPENNHSVYHPVWHSFRNIARFLGPNRVLPRDTIASSYQH